MSKQSHAKAKLLYLAKILTEETDENHTLTTNELIEKLAAYGISAERKAIYDDILTLEEFGLDVRTERSTSNKYFVSAGTFELPELKLLADAASASRFITEKKSRELIEKLSSLTSRYNGKTLSRQVFVPERLKSGNEQIYYTIDAIHEAIAKSQKLSFQYFEWTIGKTQKFRHNGERYVISPLGLSLCDNNYYLIALSPQHETPIHFRVDKITGISLLPQCSEEAPKDFDIVKYSTRTFGMYGGEETKAEILVDNSLAGVIIDRFGKDVSIIKSDDEHFLTIVSVTISPTFIGWLLSFGDKMKVLSPPALIEEVKNTLSSVTKIYDDN